MVEPSSGEPSHGPRVPHRPNQERAGAQVHLPRYRGRENRRVDGVQTQTVAGFIGRRRRPVADRNEGPRTAADGRAGHPQSAEGDVIWRASTIGDSGPMSPSGSGNTKPPERWKTGSSRDTPFRLSSLKAAARSRTHSGAGPGARIWSATAIL